MTVGVYPEHGRYDIPWDGRIRSNEAAIAELTAESVLGERPRCTWPEFCAQTLEKTSGRSVADWNDEQLIRAALSSADIANAMLGLINVEFHQGYTSVPSSLVGWTTETEISNFLSATALASYESMRLGKHTRGGTARDGYYGLLGEQWGLSRFSRAVTIDEQDILSSPSVSLTLLAQQELGKACARLPLDLVFSLLLKNGETTADGEKFFSAAHSNYSTSALDQGSLDAALAAVASQTAPDPETGLGIPLGTRGQFLVVAPALLGTARRLARLLLLDTQGDGLQVAVEPRLALGTIDPQSGEVIAGSATSWMLCSPNTIGPSVLLGGLGGPPKPRLRKLELGAGIGQPGEYGLAFDVSFDLGAVCLDWRPLFWSDGA